MSPVVRLVVTGAAMVGFFLPFFIFTVRKSEKAAVTAGGGALPVFPEASGRCASSEPSCFSLVLRPASEWKTSCYSADSVRVSRNGKARLPPACRLFVNVNLRSEWLKNRFVTCN
jgi:hypothetical protein